MAIGFPPRGRGVDRKGGVGRGAAAMVRRWARHVKAAGSSWGGRGGLPTGRLAWERGRPVRIVSDMRTGRPRSHARDSYGVARVGIALEARLWFHRSHLAWPS